MRKSTLLVKKIMICLLALIIIASPLFVPSNAHAAPGDPMFDSISSNVMHSLALDRDGRIWAWGSNGAGQFGNGTTESSGIPLRIEVMDGGSSETFKKVKAGIDSNSIALDVEGRLWTTGDDGNEKLGNGSAGSSQVWGKISVLEAGAEVEFLDILTTRRASIALDRSGELWIWGIKSPQTPIDVPVKYPVTDSGNPVTFQTIVGNDEDAIALDSQDRLWRIFMVDPSPLKYPETSAVEFQSISAGSGFGVGYHFLLALDKGGSIWTWGGDTEGELGDGPGETAITYIPAKLTVMDSGTPVQFTQISGGIRHALALDDQGNMWAWGSNSAGQLGNNSTVKSEVPVKVPLEDDSGNPLRFTSVSAGSEKSFGLDADGQIWSWGNGQHIPKKMRVSPAVSLSASNVSPGYLQPITLTAVVTGDFDNPTGTVVFKDGVDVLGYKSLTGGTTQLTGVTLSPGAHQLTAYYEGDGVYLELASDQVTVTAAANPAKEITGFSFATPVVAGTVNEASRTISVTVPYGTNVTALTPTITHTGASISPNSGVPRNFTNPVSYTVSAADGSTKSYTVTVNVAANPAKEITGFSFASPAVAGTINEASRTVSVTVP
ncbi:Ig-like domain repeat protein, partial [Paenibacillus oceani]